MAKPHTQALEFDSEDEFIKHMEHSHPAKFNSDQLSLVAENSSRPKASVFDDCPFCIGTSDNLEDHVVLHLRDLALRSLPWPDDDERGSQQGDYLHSDNSISDGNIRGTIADYISESEADSIGNADDSQRRPVVPKSTSLKAMLSRALQKSNTAVRLDDAGNFKDARLAYSEACELLQRVHDRTPGDEDKKKLKAIVSLILSHNRIQTISWLTINS